MKRPGLALLAVLLFGATACAGGSKSGGVEEHVKVLRLVSFNTDVDPQLQLLANDVARESHGSLRIDIVVGYREKDPQAEKDIIGDVRASKVDFAWVGARAWETVGVASFRALVAPFLIDSYPLQKRVLTSPLPTRMLASLRSRGLVGLAVLPGPMRRVAGRRPLLRPADFSGITFATTPTGTAKATVRALGARPVLLRNSIPYSALPPGLGGLESQLGSIAGNQYYRTEPYLTANLVFWPRPLVVFANAKAYESLSNGDRHVLQIAARDALADSTKAAERDDAGGASQLCRGGAAGSGLKVVSASPADLLALEHAVAPVYRALERDRQTRSFIAQIESLKRQVKAPVDAGLGCGQETSVRKGRGVLDGVYRRHEAPNATPENWGDYVLVIDGGRFAFTQQNARACTWQYGTLTLKGDQSDWSIIDGGGLAPTHSQNKPGEFFVFRWSRYRGVLTLHAISPPDLGTQTWQQVSTAPSPGALTRCPGWQPRKAFP